MKNLRGKIVWITGASSGIGEEMAYAMAREGAFPVLSSRDAGKLELVRKKCLETTPECWVRPMDLLNTGSLDEIVNSVLNETGRIDVLINNAGISQRSLAIETPLEIDRTIMEINFFGMVALTKLVLPGMISNQSGHVVVISSITGKFGFPMRTAYSASKHAVQGFFEALRAELNGSNIDITIVSPGRIKTSISLNAIKADGESYNKMDRGQEYGMPAGECASRIVSAIKKNRKELLVGGKEVMMVYIRRYIPWLYHRSISRIKS
jgi:dehydrogenase/reductase SDR family member 7B